LDYFSTEAGDKSGYCREIDSFNITSCVGYLFVVSLIDFDTMNLICDDYSTGLTRSILLNMTPTYIR